VVLIDSDEATRVTHETILRAEGYAIVSASAGAPALPLLREQPPALVLMASRIGPLTSLQLTRVLSGDAALRDLKILVYGPPSDEDLCNDVVRAGAHGYFILPITAQRLVREVSGVIGRP
jgi:DNA-binding NarL/FixJ family response regulator